jgi:hypothetical protein
MSAIASAVRNEARMDAATSTVLTGDRGALPVRSSVPAS